VAAKKSLVGLHQHVKNRIADSEHVVFCVSHSSVLSAAICGEADLPAKEGCGLSRSAPRQQAIKPL
jgi:hypothetical protein